MNKENLNIEKINQRYRRLNYKISRTRSFSLLQIILIVLIISPIFVLFGGLLLLVFLSANNIKIDLFPLFAVYVVSYISLIAIVLKKLQIPLKEK